MLILGIGEPSWTQTKFTLALIKMLAKEGFCLIKSIQLSVKKDTLECSARNALLGFSE